MHPEDVPYGLSLPSPAIVHSSVAKNSEEQKKSYENTLNCDTLLLTSAESLKKVSYIAQKYS